jgi:acetyl esterase/lipase
MASRESEQLADLYRHWSRRIAADPAMPIANFRALFEEWESVTAEPEGVTYKEGAIGDVPVLWAYPEPHDAERLLICLHGGGYVTGSSASHRKMFAHIARQSATPALIVDYRRAPEHPYPAPLEDALACYRAALGMGIQARKIGLVGDSAGGGLCVSTAVAARDTGLGSPGTVFLISPWLDMEVRGASYEVNAQNDLIVSRGILESLVPAVLGADADVGDALANPIRADLAGFPPTLIQVGSEEVLLDDSRAFAERARRIGVEIDLEVIDGMQHVFTFLAGVAPEADGAIERAGRWLTARLDS